MAMFPAPIRVFQGGTKMNTRIAGRSTIAFAALMTLFAIPVQAQIVAIGASNTAGRGVGASEAFPAQLEAMLRAKGRNMHVANAGISGDTTAGMLSRLSRDVPAGTKIVILQFGGNDARKGRTDRDANIAQIKSQLMGRGIRFVEADGFVKGALRMGMRLPDGQHLTVEGHRQVAAALLRAIR
jgi:acyl-CoA thioesterase I